MARGNATMMEPGDHAEAARILKIRPGCFTGMKSATATTMIVPGALIQPSKKARCKGLAMTGWRERRTLAGVLPVRSFVRMATGQRRARGRCCREDLTSAMMGKIIIVMGQ